VRRVNLYHDKRAQWAVYVVFFGILAIIPLSMDDPFTMNQYSRYGVFAMLALSVSLVWGFGGILSLGQGIAFGMAAYGMGATMQMQYQDPVNDPIPSFMLTNELEVLPTIWEPFWHTHLGLILAIGIPVLFFVIFGILMFQARIAGAFVAIMTLAMLGAWYNMAYDMQPYTAGFNGISPPSAFVAFGVEVDPYSNLIYWVSLGVLCVLTLATKALLQTKFGTIVQAIRDDPERARFLGYNVAYYQIVLFALAGLIAALAGLVWVMITQFVSPTSLDIFFSITMVIWAAVGGRMSLFGAIFGAMFINAAQSYVGDEFQATWFIILGAVFIIVVRFAPKGLAGLFEYVFGFIPYRVRGTSGARGDAHSASE
jgi:urea transport system permease protein|tara:strand:+ start:1885 stop:2991 length:1107 start_codon:yes stop_codon:yes gene_type:complete